MDTKNLTLTFLSVFFVMPALIPNQATAGDIQVENLEENHYKPLSVHRNDWAFNSPVPITNTEGEILSEDAGTPREIMTSIEDPDLYKKKDKKSKYTSKLVAKRDLEDRILDKIPYGDDLKHVWKVVDGDVDLHFTGLRADRKNTGLSYTTSDIPLIGTMDDMEFKFSAGEKNELSFKTHTIPFMGQLEGFTLKGATGDRGSRIFARYTVPLD